MDNRLIEEFEEFEGLGDTLDENVQIEDDDEDDPNFRPVHAATLSNADIYYEMEKRHLKTTGFPDTDRDILQKAFDEEFKRDLEDAKARRRELKRRAAQQAGMMKRRMIMERTLQEEQDELAKHHQIAMMIEFMKENMVAKMIRLDVNSITARSLAKAMWINSTITSLDLSSNELDDHAGIYIARILRRNRTLKKMELDNNLFGPKTCAAFGECLKINSTLVNLSLDSNPLGLDDDSGIRMLTEAIKTNNALTSLNLWRTCISRSAGVDLATSIEQNSTILFCDVGHNMIDQSDVMRITDKLDANLSAHEARERSYRESLLTAEEKEKIRKDKEDEIKKQEELAKWLEERRASRAENRRLAEEQRLAQIQLEAEERRKFEEQEREAARKAAEEAAAKKAKKKEKGKKK